MRSSRKCLAYIFTSVTMYAKFSHTKCLKKGRKKITQIKRRHRITKYNWSTKTPGAGSPWRHRNEKKKKNFA